MKHYFIKSLCLFSLVFLVGCITFDDTTTADYDSVYTDYYTAFDFTKTYTYTLPPRVIKVDDNTNPSDIPEYIDKVYSDAILNSLRDNLDSLGWIEVDQEDNPEVVLLTSASDQTYLFYDYGYWGWWYPGWGWYYPYPPIYVSGYKTGTVIIEMTDPNDLNEEDEIPVVWLGAFNGILSGSKASVVDRINKNIDQAFKHAPFNQ